MVNVSVARRYARALLELAAENNALDAVSDQLGGFVQAMQENPDLSTLLLNPAFTRAQRTQIIDGLIQAAGGVDPSLSNLLHLLVDRNRLGYLADIGRLFRDMADVRAGRVRGKVVSAAPLSKEALQKLTHSLERITQKSVLLETQVDPSLLGGVSTQVGSRIYDGSIKSQLEELRQILSQR